MKVEEAGAAKKTARPAQAETRSKVRPGEERWRGGAGGTRCFEEEVLPRSARDERAEAHDIREGDHVIISNPASTSKHYEIYVSLDLFKIGLSD